MTAGESLLVTIFFLDKRNDCEQDHARLESVDTFEVHFMTALNKMLILQSVGI